MNERPKFGGAEHALKGRKWVKGVLRTPGYSFEEGAVPGMLGLLRVRGHPAVGRIRVRSGALAVKRLTEEALERSVVIPT